MAPSQRALDRLLARLGTAPAWHLQETAEKGLRLCAARAARAGRGTAGSESAETGGGTPASPTPASPGSFPSPVPSCAPSFAVDPAQLRAALAAGLVERGGKDRLVLSQAGRARLRRMASGEEDFAAQHRETGTRRIAIAGAADEIVTVNHAESPLAWLRRRRGRNGEPILDDGQFAAGERLRADHTHGSIVPGLRGMAWSALGSGGGSSSGGRDPRGGLVELTNSTLAARARLERAMREVGPELAGVLIDVCCELKGLEQVERERRWPPRSAKVVLLLGLTRLARHYGTG
ncbi:DUF6456 domain-containing protein [Stappia indica]|uniref:DUF6456 domain-containing protein n=1 Tax=Stappia indica TaxID=538381 RepID=A0A285RS71_9HYPH|nr:DUF6456 domain-containing protein [Stappia indica]SOB97051.1 hypothetical protein SAMN05421512_102383 [Stappia indica]